MNANLLASLRRLPSSLGEGSHSFLAIAKKRSKDLLVTATTESFYLAVSFTFVTFVVGLSVSLKWRYKDQFVSGFLRSNLPAFGSPSQGISWETFQLVGSKELTPHQLGLTSTGGEGAVGSMALGAGAPPEQGQRGVAPQGGARPHNPSGARGMLALVIGNPLVERIDVYNDSFIIKPMTPWDKLKSQRFVGFYPHRSEQPLRTLAARSLGTGGVGEKGINPSHQFGASSGLASAHWLQAPARGFVGLYADGMDVARSHKMSPLPTPEPGLPSLNKSTTLFWRSLVDEDRRLLSARLNRWGYKVSSCLDELPQKLGATKLLPPDLAILENGPPFPTTEPMRSQPMDPELATLAPTFQHGGGVSEMPGARVERLDKRGPAPLQRRAPLRHDVLPGAIDQPIEQGDGLVGVRVSDELAAERPGLRASNREGNGVSGARASLAAQGRGRARPTQSGLASLAMDRQAFVKGALAWLESRGVIGRSRQDWTPPPPSSPSRLVGSKNGAPDSPAERRAVAEAYEAWLVNQLNPAKVTAFADGQVEGPEEGWEGLEGVEGLEDWEELRALLADSIPALVRSIRPVPTRSMSGYIYPDSTKTTLKRDLLYRLVRHRFDLEGAGAALLLSPKEVLLPSSPAVTLRRAGLTGAGTPPTGRPGIAPNAAEPHGHLHGQGKQAGNRQHRTRRPMPSIPMAELTYQPILLNGLASLRGTLSEAEMRAIGDGLDELSMEELTYFGPGVDRDKTTNDVVGPGRRDLTTWVVRSIKGQGGRTAATSQGRTLERGGIARQAPRRLGDQWGRLGALLDRELALSSHQGSRFGRKEALRNEPLGDEKLLGALQVRPNVDIGVGRDGTEEAPNDAGTAPDCVQPMKSNKMTGERFVTGLPRLKDPSHLLAREGDDEPALHALEIVLTKAPPPFEEEEEVLYLELDEWRRMLRGVVAQALENNASLDKIEVLLPSIVVAQGHPAKQLWAGSLAPLPEGAARRPNGDVEKRHPDGSRVVQQRPPERAASLARLLTFQDYNSLATLIAESRQFVGECNYWPPRWPGVVGGPVPNAIEPSAKPRTPRLLCHYVPLSQAAATESSTKHFISSGRYQKRLTSFTSRHPATNRSWAAPVGPLEALKKRLGLTPAGTGAASPIPMALSKQPRFHELWEPVTTHSWMMFYKLCFAFWVQEMGKDFYRRYGKEMIGYAVDLLASLGFDPQAIADHLGLDDSPIRVITKASRRFGDIAGIDSILPDLGEIVWYLRSSGRGGQVPKGILLVGPPGTGKTFLVQAIAGEAEVPVVIQSASSLRDPEQSESPTQRLRDLFNRARKLSPCILFIDEIDTLGVSRPSVLGHTMGADGVIESIDEVVAREEDAGNLAGGIKKELGDLKDAKPELDPYLSFPPSPRPSSESMLEVEEDDQPKDEAPVFREGEGPGDEQPLPASVIEVMEAHNQDRRARQQRLALLMQFLMEIDGLRTLRGVVVIGATNRPAVLDPAFIRPGRFERVVSLLLPGKEKRIEILKLYSKKMDLGDVAPSVGLAPLSATAGVARFDHVASLRDARAWDYLASRTAGWSAAHLAAAMNQSAMRAIIQGTRHTIETVEHGLNAVARRSFEASQLQVAGASGDGSVAPSMTDAPLAADATAADAPLLAIGHDVSAALGGGDHWSTSLSVAWLPAPGEAEREGSSQGPPDAPLTSPLPVLGGRNGHRINGSASNAILVRVASRSDACPEGWAINRQRESLSASRAAYYQAGKAVVQAVLPLHPSAAFLSLPPEPFTKSSSDLADLIESTGAFDPQARVVLETRLIGFYAGKAAELLALSACSRTDATSAYHRLAGTPTQAGGQQALEQGMRTSHSDLGVEELTFAGLVANSMVNAWYLYSKRVAGHRSNLSTIASNMEDIEDPVLVDVLNHADEDNQHQVVRGTRTPQRYQQWGPPSWWEKQLMDEEALIEPGYSDWYRIHLPDPKENQRNIDWVAPEDHYHAETANRLKNLSARSWRKVARRVPPIAKNRKSQPRSIGSRSQITWNDVYLIKRDYIYQGLISNCFQKAFTLLDRRREVVDLLSDHLMRYGILRQYEIAQVCANFGLETSSARGQTRSTGAPWDGNPSARPHTPVGPLSAESGNTGQAHGGEQDPSKGGSMALGTEPPATRVQQGAEQGQQGGDKQAPVEQGQRGGDQQAPVEQGQRGGGDEAVGQAAVQGRSAIPKDGEALETPPWVIQAGWGVRSRRRISRFIDFDFVKPWYPKRAK